MTTDTNGAGGLPELTEDEREFSNAFLAWRENYREMIRQGLIDNNANNVLEPDNGNETKH